MEISEFKSLVEEAVRNEKATDIEIIGGLLQGKDKNEKWLHNHYIWYYNIAKVLKPESIMELGVRFGYSLKSMIVGSGVDDLTAYAYDNQSWEGGCLDVFAEHFEKLKLKAKLVVKKEDSRRENRLQEQDVDLISIDMDNNNYRGAYQDLLLAYHSCKTGGFIIVDDTGWDSQLKKMIDIFCGHYDLNYAEFESRNKLLVIQKTPEMRENYIEVPTEPFLFFTI